MLKLRLAIISLFLCILLSVLAPGIADVRTGAALLTHFGLFSLVLTGIFIFTLAYPVTKKPNGLKMATLGVVAYLVLIVTFHYLQPATDPAPFLVFAQALSLLVIVPLSCWVSSCLTGFEKSVYQLGLSHPVADISDPESEESIQYMLMNSRYTGQSLGFISIDVSQQVRDSFQSRLLEEMLNKVAKEHWQTQISRELRKELRLIDKFYTEGAGNRLLLMCPGLNDTELAELSHQLENTISINADSASACHYVSFPDEALTLEGLIKRLDEKSDHSLHRDIPQSVYQRANNTTGQSKKLATRMPVEQSD